MHEQPFQALVHTFPWEQELLGIHHTRGTSVMAIILLRSPPTHNTAIAYPLPAAVASSLLLLCSSVQALLVLHHCCPGAGGEPKRLEHVIYDLTIHLKQVEKAFERRYG